MKRSAVVHRIAKQLGLDDIGDRPPWVYKVAALVEADEEIVYLETLRGQTHRAELWTGEIVVLTNRRVVTATITLEPSGSRVTCWPRRSLGRLHIEGSDDYWQDRETGMPDGAKLRLEYRDGDDLLIPWEADKQRTADLAALLPSLLDDLDST
jgi:hypothetical protein